MYEQGFTMQFDPQQLGQQDAYKIMVGSIVPRPIAWVSTVDLQGNRNLAPFSFFNAVGSNPPALCFAISYTADTVEHRKDTLRNIQATGEFVVNIVNEELVRSMNETATNFPPNIDEFEYAGLTAAPGVCVRAPRVAESPVSMECKLFTLVPVGEGQGSSTLVIGTISLFHVRDDLIDERHRIDIARLKPIGRLAGASYAYIRDTFEIVRGRYSPQTGEVEYPA